jgi:hypothetical protein
MIDILFTLTCAYIGLLYSADRLDKPKEEEEDELRYSVEIEIVPFFIMISGLIVYLMGDVCKMIIVYIFLCHINMILSKNIELNCI